jgi:hypothetical protein
MMKIFQVKTGRRFISAAFIFSDVPVIAIMCFTLTYMIGHSIHAAAQKSAQPLNQSTINNSDNKQSVGNIQKYQKQNTAPGEYLVTVTAKGNAKEIKRIFSKFSIVSVSGLDNTPGVFLVKFKDDPGLEAVQNTASKNGQIKAVQPNFIYRTISPQPVGPQ